MCCIQQTQENPRTHADKNSTSLQHGKSVWNCNSFNYISHTYNTDYYLIHELHSTTDSPQKINATTL